MAERHEIRNTKGQFHSRKRQQWKKGAKGFLLFLADVQPRIPTSKNTFEPFEPEPFQIEAVTKALETDKKGNFKYQTIVLCFPRRHSKTLLNCLLIIWIFITKNHQNIKIVANSERQSLSVGFSTIKKIILNTPYLRKLIGTKNIRAYDIRYPKFQSQIQAVPCNESSLYGEKITVGHVSELHAAFSDAPMQVIASSLGDTRNSLLLVDSTTDAVGGPLHRLEQLAISGEDPTVYFHKIEYQDLAEALEKSPPWISRTWLKSREKQLLKPVFASQHLNQRSAASNNLFALKDIEACIDRLPHPMTIEDLKEITHGRAFVTGAGLDRAYFGSLHGDKTIFTSVAKVAGVGGEDSDYYILHQQNIIGSLGKFIRRAIKKDSDEYELSNVCIESFNSQDIYTWALEMGIPSELIHATNTAQVPAFMELYRIVKNHKLHFSEKLKDLKAEMETFLYELKGNAPKFGSDKWPDDRIYSLVWAVYSLRQKELMTYEIGNIACQSKAKNAYLCYLRRGDFILHCAEYCPGHIEVHGLWLQHKAARVESELTLQEFYKSMVKRRGSLIYQAA